MEKKVRGYTEEGVLNALKRKSNLRVVGKQIQQLNGEGQTGKGDVGNGTKGKIDYLVKEHAYIHFYVTDFKR